MHPRYGPQRSSREGSDRPSSSSTRTRTEHDLLPGGACLRDPQRHTSRHLGADFDLPDQSSIVRIHITTQGFSIAIRSRSLALTRKPSVLIIEGVNDWSVPNNATRSLAWTIGPIPTPRAGAAGRFPPGANLRAGRCEHGRGYDCGLLPVRTPGCAGRPSDPRLLVRFRRTFLRTLRAGVAATAKDLLQTAVTDPAPTIIDPLELLARRRSVNPHPSSTVELDPIEIPGDSGCTRSRASSTAQCRQMACRGPRPDGQVLLTSLEVEVSAVDMEEWHDTDAESTLLRD